MNLDEQLMKRDIYCNQRIQQTRQSWFNLILRDEFLASLDRSSVGSLFHINDAIMWKK